ncbi:putative uncharacterized protein DDB_G0271606 [Strongylocentrotus purpuratus]|uniref:Uncharacterized protein n=1 Tax=Strongylocentrotus purpuratus TaxID=7668 RepID=A0A7M7LVS5_STRPU|nr:putative uncharacterized protein DDB_G0271606 [Strongylocentrotus purpuratus]
MKDPMQTKCIILLSVVLIFISVMITVETQRKANALVEFNVELQEKLDAVATDRELIGEELQKLAERFKTTSEAKSNSDALLRKKEDEAAQVRKDCDGEKQGAEKALAEKEGKLKELTTELERRVAEIEGVRSELQSSLDEAGAAKDGQQKAETRVHELNNQNFDLRHKVEKLNVYLEKAQANQQPPQAQQPQQSQAQQQAQQQQQQQQQQQPQQQQQQQQNEQAAAIEQQQPQQQQQQGEQAAAQEQQQPQQQ